MYDLSNLYTHMPLGHEINYASPWWAGDNHEEVTRLQSIAPATWRYHHDTVAYRFNSHGYRMAEWSEVRWDQYILVLGCSHTMGVGFDYDLLWSTRASKLIDHSVVNLAVAGSGTERVLANLSALLLYAPRPPRQIIIQWPDLYRLRGWDRKGCYEIIAADDQAPQHLLDYWRCWAYDASNVEGWAAAHRQTARALAHCAGAAYWEFTCGGNHIPGLAHAAFARPGLWAAAERELKPYADQGLYLHIPDTPTVVEWINSVARDLNSDYGAHPGQYYNDLVLDLYREHFHIG